MGKSLNNIFLIFIFLLFTIYPYGGNCSSKTLSILKKRIYGSERALSHLRDKINGIEEKLGNKNEKYIKVLGKKSEVEGPLFEVQAGLSVLEEKLKQSHGIVQSLMEKNLVNSFQENRELENLITQEVLMGKFKEEFKKLDREIDMAQTLQRKLKGLKVLFDSYKIEEEKISDSLDDLERKKRGLNKSYVGQLKKRDNLQIKYMTLQKELIKESGIKMKFRSPLGKYESFHFENKGITYKFSEGSKLFAARGGRVVHAGRLASYGNIVMMDHGSDIRSIILGDFDFHVENGAVLKKGEVLGKTKKVAHDVKGTLYFEVRKNDDIQNTTLLMNENFVTRIGN